MRQYTRTLEFTRMLPLQKPVNKFSLHVLQYDIVLLHMIQALPLCRSASCLAISYDMLVLITQEEVHYNHCLENQQQSIYLIFPKYYTNATKQIVLVKKLIAKWHCFNQKIKFSQTILSIKNALQVLQPVRRVCTFTITV